MRNFMIIVERLSDFQEEIDNFLWELTPSDVGYHDIGPYRIHYEGFSDECNDDVENRINLPSDHPKYLACADDVYDEVLADFTKRENNQSPITSGLVGDEENPIYYAIFRRLLTEQVDRPYGYWISPEGQEYPVSRMGHDDAINKIAGITYDDAIKFGWIRIAIGQSGSGLMFIELSNAITLRALLKLKNLAKGRNSFYVDISSGEVIPMNSYEYESNAEFNRHLRNFYNKKVWEDEAELTEKDKWITVYHGHQDEITNPHAGKMFSTSVDFAREYGKVDEFEIKFGNMLDTTKRQQALKFIIPLNLDSINPYTDSEIVDLAHWEEYIDHTWEFVEGNMSEIISNYKKITGNSCDTIKVTEGGIVNYIVLNTENMRMKLIESFNPISGDFFSDDDRVITLRRGTSLFHGTSSNYHPTEIKGPAWFSTKELATEYASSVFPDGYIIHEYKTLTPLKLLDITTPYYSKIFLDKLDGGEHIPMDLADIVLSRYDGWYDHRETMVGNTNKLRYTNSSFDAHGAEIFKPIVSADEVYDWVFRNHRDGKLGYHDDFEEGDIGDRIHRFKSYVLKELPLSTFNKDEFNWSEGDVEDFANLNTPFPPVIYDPIEKSIIDGTHRINAALLRGNKTIRAYVGKL